MKTNIFVKIRITELLNGIKKAPPLLPVEAAAVTDRTGTIALNDMLTSQLPELAAYLSQTRQLSASIRLTFPRLPSSPRRT